MWFWLSLIALLCWSGSDLFSKIGCRDEDDRLENEKMAFHKKVYEGFLSIAAEESRRFVRIDASGDKDKTHAEIVRVLTQRGIIPSEEKY